MWWKKFTVRSIKSVKRSITSWIQVKTRGLDHDECSTTAHPRLHEGDQPWGTVCIGAHYPSPVDNLLSESTATAEFIIFNVGSSDWATGLAEVG